MFKLNPTKLILDKTLGKSDQTTIHPYQKSPTDSRWAVKQISTKNFNNFAQAMHEAMLSFNCEHPSIVSVRGYFIEILKPRGCKVYLKMPRMQGNLSDLISKYNSSPDKKGLDLEKIVKAIYDLVNGLQYLHNRRIAHANIKPSNILTDKEGEILKLADPGSNKGEKNSYTAPEMLAGMDNKKREEFYKADVWSLGVIIAELALLKSGVVSGNSDNEKGEAVKKLVADIEKKYKGLGEVVEGMLCVDPAQRKTLGEVKRVLETKFKEIVNKNAVQIKDEVRKDNKAVSQPLRYWDQLRKGVEKTPKNAFKFEQKKGNNSAAEADSSEKTGDSGDLKEFIESIKENTKNAGDAQHMELDMSDANHITDDEVKTLVTNVSENCQCLQHLSLNLNDCHNITDESVQQLAKSVDENLKDLKNLTLKFGSTSWESNSYGNITNKGVENFFNNVSGNLKNLQQLSLSFSKCLELDNDGLQHLGTSLTQNMTNLQNLQLEFESCDRITDKGLKYLADAFEQAPMGLQQLSLRFEWCSGISDEGVSQLCNSIAKNLKSLQKLTLEFPTCLFVTKKLKNSLKETLESIPVVKIN